MQRSQRLTAARAWIDSGARVTVKTYAKWFHVDKHCAYLEMVALGIPISEADRRWATPPAPRRRRDHQPALEEELPIPDWVAWGGEWILAVDSTPAGFPIGPTLDQMKEFDPEISLPCLGSQDDVEF